jgi:HJR/Mrr/RecB family endonuclease
MCCTCHSVAWYRGAWQVLTGVWTAHSLSPTETMRDVASERNTISMPHRSRMFISLNVDYVNVNSKRVFFYKFDHARKKQDMKRLIKLLSSKMFG